MQNLKRLLYFLAIVLVISCNSENNNSFDFTETQVFTKGVEGPAVDSNGILYAVNFKEEGTIGKIDNAGKASIFIRLPNGSIGNGIRFDKMDNMYIADYINHNILKVNKASNKVVVFAHEAKANQPNDIAISPKGILYASDPNWKDNTGNIWKVDSLGFHLLEENMGTTNGIEVSADAKKLYVNESIQRNIWVYDIDSNGGLKNKKLFYHFEGYGLDGMRCDSKGNLYVCRYGAGKVVVINPKGKIIRQIKLKGLNPTNITFGGIDRKQCFITVADRGCIESFYTTIPGKNF